MRKQLLTPEASRRTKPGRTSQAAPQMLAVALEAPPLAAGDNLTRKQFLRLWELNPDIKKAELIGGIVYMPSPVSAPHGDTDNDLGGLFFTYKIATPGVASGQNATTFLLDDIPQPDINLRILPEAGGKSWLEGEYLAGSPKLLAEICLSSAAYDLHQNYDLYQAAGVQEYLAILLHEKEIRWHFLENEKYQLLRPTSNGVWRSRVFPGLWLDGPAFFSGARRRMLAQLKKGIELQEHKVFVKRLAKRRAAP